MLDALLECGRHLPVLAIVLSWTPASSWIRLRRARRGFLAALCEERLKEIAAGVPLPAATFFDAVDAALKQRCLSDAETREAVDDDMEEPAEMESEGLLPERSSSSSSSSSAAAKVDLQACEVALFALLQGRDINEAQQLTGVTPLMRAAEESHVQLCQLLLARGADANSCTIGGTTALSLALDPCCMRCLGMSQQWCSCPRRDAARLLLSRTSKGLPAAFAATVRLALQDAAWLPVVADFVEEKGLSINTELLGPDGRRGTALSVALERRVRPIEAPPQHRSTVVASLLKMRAEPDSQISYAAWWGGAAANLLDFAALNGCDEETVGLLVSASAVK